MSVQVIADKNNLLSLRISVKHPFTSSPQSCLVRCLRTSTCRYPESGSANRKILAVPLRYIRNRLVLDEWSSPESVPKRHPEAESAVHPCRSPENAYHIMFYRSPKCFPWLRQRIRFPLTELPNIRSFAKSFQFF